MKSIIIRPTLPEVLPLVINLYNEIDLCNKGKGRVGGHLHIVLDDGNIDNADVQFCLDEAIKDNCKTCLNLSRLILKMSKTQRYKLYTSSHSSIG